MIRCTNTRKAVSGIIAAIILFGMIFTTGVAFFSFMQYNYQRQHIASSQSLEMEMEMGLEQFSVEGTAVGNNIRAVVENTGPITIRVVNIFVSKFVPKVVNQTTVFVTEFVTFDDVTSDNVAVSSGEKSKPINTTASYASDGIYIIKVVTERGNIRSGTYPPPPTQMAYLSSAVGPVTLCYREFEWAEIKDLEGIDPEDPNLEWNPGWVVPKTVSKNINIVWRVKVINHFNDQIRLDNFSVLWLFSEKAAATSAWWIINLDSYGNFTGYPNGSPVILPQNPSYPDPAPEASGVIIYFGSMEQNKATKQAIGSGDTFVVFITLSGYMDGERYSQTLLPLHGVIRT